ncbi:MAG: hypothetical protein ACLUEQ_10295 [Cloacibacillus evryensis]
MIKFPSPAMCMDAVKNGVADVAANNVCVIGALLQRPVRRHRRYPPPPWRSS